VELPRLAAHLKGRIEPSTNGLHAAVRLADRVIVFTRDRAEALVDGRVLPLDAPVRVRGGVWLVPESATGRLAGRTPPATPAITLNELRWRSYPSFTRVVLETSAPLEYSVGASAGRELRVRLRSLGADPQAEAVSDGFVEGLHLERDPAGAVLRVVFEADASAPRVSTLVEPHRLVLDFPRPDEPAPTTREAVAPLRVIVLDAGHGGHDSGAVGPTGLMEKDLVLDVTRRVARRVESQLGIKVLLSRDSDAFVTLKDRTSFANRQQADLFVSIHANAHRQASWTGVETYFLSSEASDSSARQVAASENSVVQLEKNGARPRPTDAVRAILWDLAQSTFQAESSRLAEIVQDSITRSLRLPNRGVKQAGFYVLGGAAMPAILIEIGFVTNPAEERKLRDPGHRDDLARAIFAGLAEYKRHWDQATRATAARGR
jgi:N-acetylmuramoyl-L-alanine amidase